MGTSTDEARLPRVIHVTFRGEAHMDVVLDVDHPDFDVSDETLAKRKVSEVQDWWHTLWPSEPTDRFLAPRSGLSLSVETQ